MEEIVLREHTAPEVEADVAVSASDLNREDFDVRSHLDSDTLGAIDDWLIVNKVKSWGVLDLMVVDGGHGVRSSFDKFSKSQITNLFEICLCGMTVLRAMNVQKIFIGANVNHGFKNQQDAFLRLHLHILGLRKSDFAKMKPIQLSNLTGKDDRIKDLILDPLLEEFQEALVGEFNGVFGGAEKYQFGLRFNLDSIDAELLSDAIYKIDSRIADKFPSLSYSFCVVFEEDRIHLNISPRSVYGKGVLESEGILLKRSSDLKFSPDELQERNKFYLEFVNELSGKFSNFIEGKYQIYSHQEVE